MVTIRDREGITLSINDRPWVYLHCFNAHVMISYHNQRFRMQVQNVLPSHAAGQGARSLLHDFSLMGLSCVNYFNTSLVRWSLEIADPFSCGATESWSHKMHQEAKEKEANCDQSVNGKLLIQSIITFPLRYLRVGLQKQNWNQVIKTPSSRSQS
jgi:hypothetical protein